MEGDWSNDLRGYGFALDVDGDRAVVGAPWTDRGGSYMGLASIVERVDGAWAHVGNLYPEDAFDEARFGYVVALDGDTIVVASREADALLDSTGALYVFERDGAGIWQLVQRIDRADPAGRYRFEAGLSLEGDTLTSTWIHCVYGEAFCYPQVVVYARDGETWGEQQVIEMSAPEVSFYHDFYRMPVEMENGAIVVGLPWYSQEPGGSVLAFEEDGGVWSQVQSIAPVLSEEVLIFGYSLSMDGDTLLVGAPGDGSCAAEDLGAAYFYAREAGSWQLRDKVCAPDDMVRPFFGASVSVNGDMAVISSASVFGDEFIGSVAVHQLAGESWVRNLVIDAIDGDSGALFGISAALQGHEAFIGAPGRISEDEGSLGAMYVYDVSCADEAACPSGFCVDGVCCESECGGGDPLDCQGCAVVTGASQDGVCEPLDGAPCGIWETDSPDGVCVEGECVPVPDEPDDDADTDTDTGFADSDDDDSDGGAYPACFCSAPGAGGELSGLIRGIVALL